MGDNVGVARRLVVSRGQVLPSLAVRCSTVAFLGRPIAVA